MAQQTNTTSNVNPLVANTNIVQQGTGARQGRKPYVYMAWCHIVAAHNKANKTTNSLPCPKTTAATLQPLANPVNPTTLRGWLGSWGKGSNLPSYAQTPQGIAAIAAALQGNTPSCSNPLAPAAPAKATSKGKGKGNAGKATQPTATPAPSNGGNGGTAK